MLFNFLRKNTKENTSFATLDNSQNNINYHFIFHLHCVNHEKIHYAIAKLKQNLYIFNGYKIITVSSPNNEFHNNIMFQKIVDELYDPRTIIIPCINSSTTKESSHFFDKSAPLLRSLLKNDKEQNFVFFGHGKGCSHPEKDYAVTCWVNTLWKYNIDLFFDLVKPKIESKLYNFIGCLRTDKDCYFNSSFHYSGTFFWFDAGILFQDDWYKPHNHLLSLEMWPGLVSSIDQSVCLFDVEDGNKYQYNFWYNQVFNKRVPTPHTIK